MHPQKVCAKGLSRKTFSKVGPIHLQKSPTYPQKSPIYPQKSPMCPQKVCAKGLLRKKFSKGEVGGLGSRPKKMYGERLGDGVEYHLMSPMPRR